MNIQQIILETLTYGLPFVALILPGLLKQDKLTPVQNSAIAGSTVIVVSVAQAFSAGQLGINPLLDLPIVVAAVSTMLSGPLKPIDLYLQSNLGLVGAKPVPPAVQTPGATPPQMPPFLPLQPPGSTTTGPTTTNQQTPG